MAIVRQARHMFLPSVMQLQTRAPGNVLPVSPWYLEGGVSAGSVVAVYEPKGSASLAASYVNIADPGTHDAFAGTAPTLDADGWVFNGSSQYLKTDIVPASDQSYSCLLRFSNRGNTGFPLHVRDANADRRFGWYIDNSNIYHYNGGVRGGSTATAAVVAVAGNAAYLDGVPVGSIAAWGGSHSYAIYIGAGNVAEAVSSYFACKIQAIAIYSTALSAGQVAAISSAMAAL